MLMSMGFTRNSTSHPFNSADLQLTLRSDDALRSLKVIVACTCCCQNRTHHTCSIASQIL